jgi:Phage head completion protein (GPL)
MTDHVSIIAPPLAAAPPPLNPESDKVDADGWWPSVGINAFRALHRVAPEITPERVRAAIRTGMQTALIDLGEWCVLKRAEGHASLAAVPAVQIDGVSHFVLCWHRAVGALAKAELSETHRDYDATGSGERKNDGLDLSIEQLRRDAQHAIRDLKGARRTVAELI